MLGEGHRSIDYRYFDEEVEGPYRGIIRTGSYGLVSLVRADFVQQGVDKAFKSKARWGLRLGDFFSGVRRSSTAEAFDIGAVTHRVIDEGVAREDDIGRFPRDVKKRSDLIKLANIIAGMASLYGHRVLQEQRTGNIGQPYTLGLQLSDFLEVVPPEVAARVLFAASDPDIAQTILKGQGSLRGLRHIDVQPHAVEAVVLLPKDARHEIFTQMVALEPGIGGRANRFFGVIASNWANRTSDYCGQTLIYQNLQGDRAMRQILEMQTDLAELGPLVRGEAVRS